jgi:hypothetical protein
MNCLVRSNAGIVGSNPTQGMDVCIVCVYSVFMLCVLVEVLRRADLPFKESYRLCIGSRNWKSGQGPTKGCRAIMMMMMIIIIIIINLCTWWRWAVSFTPWPLYLLGRAESESYGDKNVSPMTGIETWLSSLQNSRHTKTSRLQQPE